MTACVKMRFSIVRLHLPIPIPVYFKTPTFSCLSMRSRTDQNPLHRGFTGIADSVKNFAVLYVCDLDQVPDFKQMYELYDPVTLMFFFRNKHMMCDFGTGNNNKLNWVLEDKQELIDIIETIYRGAKKGRGLVVSPKGAFIVFDRLLGWREGSRVEKE